MVFVVLVDSSEVREGMGWVREAMERSLSHFFSSLGLFYAYEGSNSLTFSFIRTYRQVSSL